MIFYGLSHNYPKKAIKTLKRYRNQKLRKYGFTDFRSPTINYKSYIFNIPSNWKFIVLNNPQSPIRSVYLYSSVYYFHLFIPSNHNYLNIDQNTNSITFWALYRNSFYKTYWTLLTQTFNSFSRPFFLKVKFKGKGYYIFNTLT